MKNRIVIRHLLLAAIVSLSACATGGAAQAGRGKGLREFKAVSYQYNVNASPRISSRKFKSRISISKVGGVKVIEIRNYPSRKPKPDAKITIAVSGADVGSAIYNAQNELIAEFGSGKIVNNNFYSFKQKNETQSVTANWFVEDNFIMSEYTLTDKNNTLLYKETVIYISTVPLRRK